MVNEKVALGEYERAKGIMGTGHYNDTYRYNSDNSIIFDRLAIIMDICNEGVKDSVSIANFEDAVSYLLDNKSSWTYGPDKNENTTAIHEINRQNQELRSDATGEFYSIPIMTDDGENDGSITQGGKQFRVYTNGKIDQRAGMHEFFEIVPAK
ncbi:hypothetical protein JZO70_05195 [Enterococcus sp. 669A]|uniref:Uncharacterized protein n=2 Tax=Candidatus Enterococcus moelleringii TaxID=2815325 RepID=A0ABS3L7E3_9ENTE|nr:hypothetical protein [Enterococcus sp. 669A]